MCAKLGDYQPRSRRHVIAFPKIPRSRGLNRFGLGATLGGAIRREEASGSRASKVLSDFQHKALPGRRITPEEAQQFSQLPLTVGADGLLSEIDHLMEQGVTVDTIYIDLLAPAARRMGELWEEDQCDFVDVTMGLWRLQEVLHEISSRTPSRSALLEPGARRAMFLPMPGDQHFLGPQMLEDVFARSGWDTLVMTKPLRRDVLNLLSNTRFDLVGLTLSRDCPSAAVKSIIRAVRSVSRNEHISILVGGHMINQNPALVAEVGADGTGADARSALEVAEALVQSAKVRAQTLK